MAQQRPPRQSLPTSPCSTWIQGGSCWVFDFKMYTTIVAMRKGMQQSKPNTKRIPVLKVLNRRRIVARQRKGPNIEQADMAAITSIKINPTIKQSWMFAAETFARAPSTALMSLSLTWKSFPTSPDMILERLRGKLLHEMLWASPTQNCVVPIEQFIGIVALITLRAPVTAVLTALWTRLTAPGIAVVRPLVALSTPLWNDSMISRSGRSFVPGRLN